MAASMDFRILGPLEVVRAQRSLTIAGNKQRALLAVLLLHANETLTSDALIDALWGEAAPANAAKTLQVHISRLRKALGDRDGARLLTRERGYQLAVDPERLDIRLFERLLERGRAELADGRPDAAVQSLDDALALWRGPPLAEFAYEPFAQSAIARVEDLRLGALEQLFEAKLALGRHAEVVGDLETLIAEHPYRERLRAQLMLALYRGDRQADALQAYQDARRALVEDLGIEPGERLRELEAAILAQDSRLELVLADDDDAKDAATASGFVGRRRELRELTAALESAMTGRGGVVLLAGEPGIGKSRLAEELTAHAAARDARVLVGRCWEAGGAPPFWPWVQVLRAHLGVSTADLRQLVPELADEAEEPASEGLRFRLFDAVSALLRSAADEQPTIVVLDDVHAADEPSLLLLRFVARGIASSRLLVVCAYRDLDPALRDPLSSTVAELLREPHTVHVGLSGLGSPEIADYIRLTTGTVPPDRLVDAIHLETEGNPLFVAQVVRLLESENVLSDPDAHLRIPPEVRTVITRRVARLSAGARDVLVHASVMGREFDLGALAHLSDLDRSQLLDRLDEAMGERVLTDAPGSPGRLRFGHALIRDTLYDELTAARRIQLHRAAGEALEAVYASDLEPHLAELARHFVAAAPTGTVEKAAAYARRAGEHAATQLAFEEAGRHFGLALQFVRDEPERCELLLALGDAEARAGDAAASKTALREAAAIASRSGLAELLGRAALGYGGRFGWARASTDPALVPMLEAALAAIGDEHPRLRVQILARLAAALRDEPLREPRLRAANEALAIADGSTDPRMRVDALAGRWIAIEGPDHIDELIEVGNELVGLARRLGDKERLFGAHDARLNVLWARADRAAVDAELEILAALAAELRQPAQHWFVGTARTIVALMEGDFKSAERLIAATAALGRHAQSWNATVSERLALFVLRRAQGRLAELESTIRASVDEYPTLFRFRCALVHLHAELGREEDTRAGLQALLSRDIANEYVDAEWLISILMLADPAAAYGGPVEIERLHALLSPHAERYAHAPVETTFGCVARGVGVLAAALGRFEEAEREFERAVAIE